MDRRTFLRMTASTGALAVFGSQLAACGDEGAAPERTAATTPPVSRAGARSYGPLADEPDENGLLLPAGFTSTLLAVGGETVPGTSYRWHPFPDGGACFALDDGWVYVSNSEVPATGHGGAGALRFDADGRVVDAYPILGGTTMNCAGGATPWGTWLSCEEIMTGQVWECDPLGRRVAIARPAMGYFRHETVVADPVRRVLYESEDERDGLLYRFRPTRWGDLSTGELDALVVDRENGAVSWTPVRGIGIDGPRTRYDAPGAKELSGCEGLALDGDVLYLATKGDDRISRIDLDRARFEIHWEGSPVEGPDNLTVHEPSGNLIVCEDSADMEVVSLATDGHADPILRFVGHDRSEVTGAAFDPSGTRLVLSSQRAPTPTTFADIVPGGVDWPLGRTYLISGPF